MKIYFQAEKHLVQSGPGGGSLQSRIFADKKLDAPKHVFALAISTLKYKPYIMEVIKKSKIKQFPEIKKLKVSDTLLCLVIHDLVFSSKGRIHSGKHPIKNAILLHKTRLQSEFVRLKLRYKVRSADLLPNVNNDDETPVRWFRVNAIKIDEDTFFEKYAIFKNLQPVSRFQDLVQGTIYKDHYIPRLYGVHPREKITDSEPYKKGELIIQDRASCFPAHIMYEDPSCTPNPVIDATSAPGNKTTHAASYICKLPNALVYAFERDSKRVEVLKSMCQTATGKNSDLIHVTKADFTTVKPEDFKDIEGLIVDPSCSGSGIFGRAIEDHAEDQEEDVNAERLNKLSRFQFKIMKHALSFPSARKVVYSTCSIHAEENERVVVDLLMDEDLKAMGWKLAPREIVIPDWPRRGWTEEFTALKTESTTLEQLAGGCVRALPKEDGGIGFFAACFVRDCNTT